MNETIVHYIKSVLYHVYDNRNLFIFIVYEIIINITITTHIFTIIYTMFS